MPVRRTKMQGLTERQAKALFFPSGWATSRAAGQLIDCLHPRISDSQPSGDTWWGTFAPPFFYDTPGDDPHRLPTAGAEERQDFIDTGEQHRPQIG